MKSLFARFSYPVILVLGISMLAVILLAVANIHAFITPSIRDLTTDLMASKANEVDYWLQMRETELLELARRVDLPTGSDAEIAAALPMLTDYQSRHGDVYESMGIVSLTGISHVTSGDVFDVTNREYYAKMQQPEVELFVSDVLVSRANEASILVILCKIRNSTGVVTGYCSSAVSVGYLNQIVSRANVYDFPVWLVNRQTGSVLAASGNGEGGGGANFSAVVNTNPDWQVETLVPDSFLNRQVNRTVLLTGAFGALVFLTALLLSRRHAARLAAPISSLQFHMQALEGGSFLPISPDSRCTELNSLGRSFNAMLAYIQALLNQVRDEQQQKRDAEYRALCAQIKPHFLYNTLETIQSMVVEADYANAQTAIGDLANFFRTAVLTEQTMIPLSDELGHLESYLKIQNLRYEGRFRCTLDYSNVPLSLPVMKFTLQPLIENAINHGIRTLRNAGEIRISLLREEGALVIEVRNTFGAVDGVRIAEVDAKLAAGSPSDAHGHGISNVNRRLKLEFGPSFGVRLFVDGDWVVARVRHPILPVEGSHD